MDVKLYRKKKKSHTTSVFLTLPYTPAPLFEPGQYFSERPVSTIECTRAGLSMHVRRLFRK